MAPAWNAGWVNSPSRVQILHPPHLSGVRIGPISGTIAPRNRKTRRGMGRRAATALHLTLILIGAVLYACLSCHAGGCSPAPCRQRWRPSAGIATALPIGAAAAPVERTAALAEIERCHPELDVAAARLVRERCT